MVSNNSYTNSHRKNDTDLVKQQFNIEFRDITYTISAPKLKGKATVKTILNAVSGVFEAGKITAIVGPTGAGKTSLLNVIAAQTNNGEICGNVYLNGQHVQSSDIHAVSGFVYQKDIFYSTMTIRDALMMSAILRCSDLKTKEERLDRVQSVLEVFGLDDAADTLIGNWHNRGISGGEKKRTSIAAELVTNPSVIFLDEPTTGLDSLVAYQTIAALNRLARDGRTIVTTLHQPTYDIFNMVDNIIFIAEGRIIYAGPTNRIIKYFSQLGLHCPVHNNPMDFFFLEIFHQDNDNNSGYFESSDKDIFSSRHSLQSSTTTVETKQKDNFIAGSANQTACLFEDKVGIFLGVPVNKRLEILWQAWENNGNDFKLKSSLMPFNKSNEKSDNHRDENTNQNADLIRYAGRKTCSFRVQWCYLLKRSVKNLIRNPSTTAMKAMQMVVGAFVFLVVYWRLYARHQQNQIEDLGGMAFFMCSVAIWQFSFTAASAFCVNREVFTREYRCKYYNLSAYFFSVLIIDLPLHAAITLIFYFITYYGIGLNPEPYRAGLSALIAILQALCGFVIGLGVSCVTRRYDHIPGFVVLFIVPMMVYGGLFANLKAMAPWLRWLSWLSPIKYGFVAMLRLQAENTELSCGDNPKPGCVPIPGESILKHYKLDSSDGSTAFNISMIFVILFVAMVVSYIGYFITIRKERMAFNRKFLPPKLINKEPENTSIQLL
ncbi:P-loop containing nucleoside triphosphate hydrolase protein [Syncephalis fuscata]|nr:P-loop containing nucleoside triphosphate hydrolase protein [Syncephalis fuscata]